MISEPSELIICSPADLALRAYVRRWRALAVTCAWPSLMLVMAAGCEYVLRSAFGDAWVESGGVAAVLHLVLAAVRMLAAGFMLASPAWYLGASLFEQQPSVSEAIGEGWRASVRCGLTVLPLWFLSVVYVFVAALVARAAWTVYLPAGPWMAWLALLWVLSLAVPPLLAMTARYLPCIQVALFDRLNPFQALSVAAVHMSWRTLMAHWAAYAGCALCIVVTVLAPSWLSVGSVYLAVAPRYATAETICVGQVCAAVCALVLVPLGMAATTVLYFRMRPDYWAAQEPPEPDQAVTDMNMD